MGQQPRLGPAPAQQQQHPPKAHAALPESPGAQVQTGSQRTASGAEQDAVLVHAAEALVRLNPASCWRPLQWAL